MHTKARPHGDRPGSLHGDYIRRTPNHFPIEWSHSIDQKSLQIQKLEHIRVDRIEPI
ncbi:hypothetical protein MPC4_180053 [Methylocella tundrae]|uniref:Uncharacterized protein n=1 Tax=Methylocella tundrae TaxID=227605 RepID=A0A8B6M3M2_METTU|nr:hypothetical protein MPC1_11270001 [Methylocella tundrae]VTZ49647.1 hypothetical protein MPC4_180053 [Methylocella tundrae]